MGKCSQLSVCFILIAIIGACSPPPAITPVATPQIIHITQKVIITQVMDTPTPNVVVVTNTPEPTLVPEPESTAMQRSHEWVDYGGICMRPDNLPNGVSISPNQQDVEDTRTQILAAIWRAVEVSGNVDRVSPKFSSPSNFRLATQSGTLVRGNFLPAGKNSNHRRFRLEDPVAIWEGEDPDLKIQGVALDIICIEFFNPMEFENQKHLKNHPTNIKLSLPYSNELTSVIFAMDRILDQPRIVIKVYTNPFGERGQYPEFIGFQANNTVAQNAQAANDHLGVLVACLNNVSWANHDGDNLHEFGYHWLYTNEPLPATAYQTIHLFSPAP